MRALRIVAVVGVVAAALAGAGYLAYARLAGGEEEGGGEEGQPARVVLAAAETARVARTIEAVGTLIATESVGLAAEVAGRVVAIEFRQGERVEAGQVLVRLEADEAEAELRALRAEADEIGRGLARAEQLLDSGAGRRAQVEDQRARLDASRARADAAAARLDDLTVRAPFAGRVGLREVSVGALVDPGRELVTLDAVSPIDLALRAFELEARLPNEDGALRPGMFMGVEVAAGVREDAVVVPPIAVQARGQTHFVFRVEGDKAERVEVRLGQRAPGRLEIVEGLKAGDRVVIEGLQRVADGKPVEVQQPPPADPKAPEGTPSGPGGGAANAAPPAS